MLLPSIKSYITIKPISFIIFYLKLSNLLATFMQSLIYSNYKFDFSFFYIFIKQ